MSASHSILLTGATGFVGGTILHTLCNRHPTSRIKVLVRQGSSMVIQSAYPKLELVVGDLSSLSLLTTAAADADFVIHAAGDNVPAVCAMIDGLASRHGSEESTARIISITGPRSLIDLSKPITGDRRENSRPWSDIVDAHAILGAPQGRMHADADQAIIAHSIAQGIGTILVSPGQLWGQGKGPLKTESNSATYYSAVKRRGRAFVVGSGTATWSWTSVGDLADAVLFLMERSLIGGSEERSRVGVNRDGYYFVSTGDLSMIERATAVSERLNLAEVDSISAEDAKAVHPMGHIMWGCGERTRADKLAQLGWKPRDLDWKVLMEEGGGERA